MQSRERDLRREIAAMVEEMYMHENDRDYYENEAHSIRVDPNYENEEGHGEETLENLAEQEDQAARSHWPYIEEALSELSDIVGYTVTTEDFEC